MYRRAILVFWLVGCGPVLDPSSAESTSSGGPPSTTMATTNDSTDDSASADAVTSSPPDPTTMSTSATSTTDDSGHSFSGVPDGGGVPDECDIWAQDCPRGYKCMPWANDGGNAWNDTRCTPIDPDANDVGEPCTVEGNGVSGIDDCVLGAMCWNVDVETNMGECVAFCQGSEAEATCENPCERCNLTSEGVLILCLPACDPIAQDCNEGQACYPINDGFACAPDASGEAGVVGDPCEFINVCDAGNWCAEAENVPGCEGMSGCCAPFCNVDAMDGCDALLPGTTCVPWYEEGQEPEPMCMTATVGTCVVLP